MQQPSSLQLFGRLILVTLLILAAIWILRHFLPALAWAGVVALATWPAREWLVGKGMRPSGAGILLALVIGILIIGPLILLAIEMAREASVVVETVRQLRKLDSAHRSGCHKFLS